MWVIRSKAVVRWEEKYQQELVRNLNNYIAEQKAYIAKCEKLIEQERSRAEAERQRADRQLDGLLQQSGLPPVTQTTLDAREEREALAKAGHEKEMKQINEIYAEQMDDAGVTELNLPPDVQAAALGVLDGKR